VNSCASAVPGVIGMMNFTPDGAGGDFFRVLGSSAPPPPPGAIPPLAWGTENHVRKLFGEGVRLLTTTRHEYVDTAPSPREYFDLFAHAFGPMVAIRAGLGGQPTRQAELDKAFLEFIARWNRGGARVRIPYEYLLVMARKRGPRSRSGRRERINNGETEQRRQNGEEFEIHDVFSVPSPLLRCSVVNPLTPPPPVPEEQR
jgi:hypothetical protein